MHLRNSGKISKTREFKIERSTIITAAASEQDLRSTFWVTFYGANSLQPRKKKHKENNLQQEANTLIDPRPTASMKIVANNGSFVDV